LEIISPENARNALKIVRYANLRLNALNVTSRQLLIPEQEDAIVLLDTQLIYQVKVIKSKSHSKMLIGILRSLKYLAIHLNSLIAQKYLTLLKLIIQ